MVSQLCQLCLTKILFVYSWIEIAFCEKKKIKLAVGTFCWGVLSVMSVPFPTELQHLYKTAFQFIAHVLQVNLKWYPYQYSVSTSTQNKILILMPVCKNHTDHVSCITSPEMVKWTFKHEPLFSLSAE